ncbi:MAG: hypothetical protein AAGA66_11045 [Bacteroidota bacterium]
MKKRSHRGNNLLASDKSTFTTEKELREVVVEGERSHQEVRKVFGKMDDRGVNNFVFEDTVGIKAIRLTTSGRKALETAINAAGITPTGGLVAAGVQVFSGVADEKTAVSAGTASTEVIAKTLTESDVLTDLFKKISSMGDKGLLILNQLAILDSPPTRDEQLTKLVFEYLIDNEFGDFILGKELEQFVFNKKYSKYGTDNIIRLLNTIYSSFAERLQHIDLTTKEGLKLATKHLNENQD